MRFSGWAAAAGLVALVGCGSDDSSGDSNGQTSMGSDSGGSDSSAELGCAAGAVGETTDGATDALQQRWGAQCSTNEECVALLGEGAVCDDAAVVYELPGGYCTKPCMLPDANTRFIMDDPNCDPQGGVACIGVMGTYERCTPLCTDDGQCNRDGYICRQMPLISMAGDPKACLMPDCCQESCAP